MQRHDRLDGRVDHSGLASLTSTGSGIKSPPTAPLDDKAPFPSVPETCGNVWTPHIHVRPSVVQLTRLPQYFVVQSGCISRL